MSANSVQIAAPLPHQEPIVASPASRKVLRAGRRAGKTRVAWYCAVVGHGPEGDHIREVNGEIVDRWTGPLHRGIAHGLDVFWIARDIPQSRTLWHEEIKPRFRGNRLITVNETEKRVELPGGGKLWIRSAENINSVRGAGASLVGVIVDEAAWQDLETELKEVILPALLDNGGWLMLLSTTNCGPDGHINDNGQKRTPSYFNIICEEIQSGRRSGEWQEFHFTAFDNPKLSQEAIRELIDEYDPDSIELAQEVYAKLVQGGAGLAFPEWDEEVHETTFCPELVSGEYRWTAGMDWGYTNHGWFGLFATGPERSICRWEYYFKELDPYTVGYNLGQSLMRFPRLEWIALDSACWAVTDGGPTIAEEIMRGMKDAIVGVTGDHSLVPAIVPTPKGAGSRITGKQILHRMLRFEREEDGTVKPWNLPELIFHKDAKHAIRTIPRLMRDERNPEDVDTRGEDHPYDGVRYWIMYRTPQVERTRDRRPKDPDAHPGWTDNWQRRDAAPPMPNGDGGHRWTRVPEGIA